MGLMKRKAIYTFLAMCMSIFCLFPGSTLLVHAEPSLFEQMKFLEQLSPDEKARLIDHLERGDALGAGGVREAPESPEVVKPLPDLAPGHPSLENERIEPGDTLLVRRMENGGILPGSSPDSLEEMYKTRQKAAEIGPRRDMIAQQIAEFPEQAIYRVTPSGEIYLPEIGHIPVAGLTMTEAALRMEAEPLLRGIKVSISRFSHHWTRDDDTLEAFGYDLFAGVPSTFAPATDIPVPADYVIGPGDVIDVQLYGKEHEEYSLPVTRDGSLMFPGVGPIAVTGLNFSQMRELLRTRVEEQFIGVKISISMGSLRSIRVFVLGDVARPGSYTVSGLSTLTHALFVSGGVKKNGSLRNVELKRKGKIVSKMDFYSLLLHGDTSNDMRLLPGDVIFVPPIGSTVAVAGEVRRPAIYELLGEKTVADVLELAGGLRPTANAEDCRIERVSRNRERILVELSLNRQESLATPLHDGDTVRVYSVKEELEEVVSLKGHVQTAGLYQWKKEMHLVDLLPGASSLLPDVDTGYVLIVRENTVDRTISAFSADLGAAWSSPGSKYDPPLEMGDQVIVFGRMEERTSSIEPIITRLTAQTERGEPVPVVYVDGSVHHPGSYPLDKGMCVSDLIRASGRLTESAYTLAAELTRYSVVDGKYLETGHVQVDLAGVLANDPETDLGLRPHDALHIKKTPLWKERQVVKIEGQVRFSGVYPISQGETLRSVLERAGGLTEFAYPEGSVFMREELRSKEQEQIDAMAVRLESDLAVITMEKARAEPEQLQAYGMIQSLVSQLRKTKATGRLVIDLAGILSGVAEDIVLKDGDKLFVPSRSQEVTVLGEVLYPTSHMYEKGLDRNIYINMSGGYTYKADKKRIYIVRANGAVLADDKAGWFRKTNQIHPGDTIVVPLNAERVRPLTLATNVAQILYQLGLTAAAWNTIGVF
jgi:polysaccharide export outer membrane protein